MLTPCHTIYALATARPGIGILEPLGASAPSAKGAFFTSVVMAGLREAAARLAGFLMSGMPTSRNSATICLASGVAVSTFIREPFHV